MAMQLGGRASAKAEINVTPLVDVALVLLILFMVLTPLQLKELPVDLPQTVEVAQPMVPSEQLVITLGPQGTLQLAGQPVEEAALPDRVRHLLGSRPDKTVFFDIDDGAAYGDSVRIMDIARGAGATRLGVVGPK